MQQWCTGEESREYVKIKKAGIREWYPSAQLGCPSKKLLCNNDALVKKVENMWKSKRPEFANDTLAPSWDVLQRKTKNLRKLPEESSLRWIPSHQDDKTPIEQLPPDARLNVRADKQAGQFQQLSPHHQHDCDSPMINGTRCHLVINDYVIGSKHKRIARAAPDVIWWSTTTS
jgi:hypothetical protein